MAAEVDIIPTVASGTPEHDVGPRKIHRGIVHDESVFAPFLQGVHGVAEADELPAMIEEISWPEKGSRQHYGPPCNGGHRSAQTICTLTA